VIDARHSMVYQALVQQEYREMMLSGARPVSVHMSVDQCAAWEMLAITVEVISKEMLNSEQGLGLSHTPVTLEAAMRYRPKTMMGLVIFESLKMPPDRIEFRNAEGEKVGEIINLAVPAELE
jgi:hypothetical protein